MVVLGRGSNITQNSSPQKRVAFQFTLSQDSTAFAPLRFGGKDKPRPASPRTPWRGGGASWGARGPQASEAHPNLRVHTLAPGPDPGWSILPGGAAASGSWGMHCHLVAAWGLRSGSEDLQNRCLVLAWLCRKRAPNRAHGCGQDPLGTIGSQYVLRLVSARPLGGGVRQREAAFPVGQDNAAWASWPWQKENRGQCLSKLQPLPDPRGSGAIREHQPPWPTKHPLKIAVGTLGH